MTYLNGREVRYGTPKPAVRVDAIDGPATAPTHVYDLKTGAKGLTPAREAQIRRQLPAASRNVPITEVRP